MEQHQFPIAILERGTSGYYRYWVIGKKKAVDDVYFIELRNQNGRRMDPPIYRASIEAALETFAEILRVGSGTRAMVLTATIPSENYDNAGLFGYPQTMVIDGKRVRVYETPEHDYVVVSTTHDGRHTVEYQSKTKSKAMDYFEKLSAKSHIQLFKSTSEYAWNQMPPEALREYAVAYLKQRLISDRLIIGGISPDTFECRLPETDRIATGTLIIVSDNAEWPRRLSGNGDFVMLGAFQNNCPPKLYCMSNRDYIAFAQTMAVKTSNGNTLLRLSQQYDYTPQTIRTLTAHNEYPGISLLPDSRAFLLAMGANPRLKGVEELACALDLVLTGEVDIDVPFEREPWPKLAAHMGLSVNALKNGIRLVLRKWYLGDQKNGTPKLFPYQLTMRKFLSSVYSVYADHLYENG